MCFLGYIWQDETSASTGLDNTMFAQSANFADLDNDGDLDLFVAVRNDPQISPNGFTNLIYENQSTQGGTPTLPIPPFYEGSLTEVIIPASPPAPPHPCITHI